MLRMVQNTYHKLIMLSSIKNPTLLNKSVAVKFPVVNGMTKYELKTNNKTFNNSYSFYRNSKETTWSQKLNRYTKMNYKAQYWKLDTTSRYKNVTPEMWLMNRSTLEIYSCFIIFHKSTYHMENNWTLSVTDRLLQMDSPYGLVTRIRAISKSQKCLHFGIFIHAEVCFMILNIDQESIS